MPRVMLVIIVLVALAPHRASAGACAQPPPVVRVLTTTDIEISSGGGIVAQVDDPAKAPAWRFAGANADATVKRIAPGLGTIDLPPSKRWVTLTEGKKPLVRVRAAKVDAPPLGAPEVTRVERTSQTGRRGTSVTTEATVKGVPPDALALVVFGAGKTGRLGRSWASVASSAGLSTGPHASLAIQIYASGSCMAVPVGWTDSRDGDKIELAWLDRSGRLSKSTTITVTAKLPSGPSGD